MKTKHTPAPWIVKNDYTRDVIGIPNDDTVTICETGSWSRESKEEMHANSKLIASAPELLEAVIATQAFFDDMPKGQFGKLVLDVGLMNDMFIALAKSLKKATE